MAVKHEAVFGHQLLWLVWAPWLCCVSGPTASRRYPPRPPPTLPFLWLTPPHSPLFYPLPPLPPRHRSVWFVACPMNAQKLLRLKDLRIESLMLLHTHRQGRTSAIDQRQHRRQQRDEDAVAANGNSAGGNSAGAGDGDGGDGGRKLAGGSGGGGGGTISCITPTRMKKNGEKASSSSAGGGGGRQERSPRGRRLPRSAESARGSRRGSSLGRTRMGTWPADPPGGGNGRGAAFPSAPPPSPMAPQGQLKRFNFGNTEDADNDYVSDW